MSRLPFGRMRFRPQLFWQVVDSCLRREWTANAPDGGKSTSTPHFSTSHAHPNQEILPEHVVDASLQFEADFASGKNYARVPSGDRTFAPDGALARATAVALDDVPFDAPDAEAVARVLRAAATWGDHARLRQLLCSCYCGVGSLTGALHEAAARGELACIEVLLVAGASASCLMDHRTALHAACESTQEEAARILIAADPTLLSVSDANGRTPLEVAELCDYGPMARRLRTFAEEQAA